MKRETLTQAAARTGLPKKTIRNAALRGKIPFIRNGEGPTARILLLPEDLDHYIKTTLLNRRVLSPREYAQCRAEAKGEG